MALHLNMQAHICVFALMHALHTRSTRGGWQVWAMMEARGAPHAALLPVLEVLKAAYMVDVGSRVVRHAYKCASSFLRSS